ncbi:hypothetical protein [Phaffia rhodozyma]|uniref:Uncharacterized protein n=1 Tax=Phaffia rhodozyma TaxID=264483 RepID=A0A0F7ST34_PHARH|nr:hypothetical protein [Phaffia rhodozyma]
MSHRIHLYLRLTFGMNTALSIIYRSTACITRIRGRGGGMLFLSISTRTQTMRFVRSPHSCIARFGVNPFFTVLSSIYFQS